MNQNSSYSFAPSRSGGVFFFVGVLTVLIAAETMLLNIVRQIVYGLPFVLLIIAMVILAVPLFFCGFRFFSLLYSAYTLERDGLHIRWGLRKEIIPLNAIEWIRRPEEMPYEVPWSFLPMPGAYLGNIPSEVCGAFEFLASDMNKMLFLGTAKQVYCISPAHPELFVEGFDRMLQLGALENIGWKTFRPGSWLTNVWKNRYGKFSIIVCLNLLAILFLWVGIRFQQHANISLQFSTTGKAEEKLPVDNILILPILASLSWLLGMTLGSILYRKPEMKRTAELVFCFSILSVAHFLAAAFIIF